jgi:DNA-binding NarL/FixJ family response regulator
MTLTAAPGAAGSASEERRPHGILLIDPQRLFRQALRALLEADGAFRVVGETGSAAEALELAANFRPDIVVTELHVGDGRGTIEPSGAPESSGAALIGMLRSRFPAMAILVLTSTRAHDVAPALKKAGALGYLLKEHGREELFRALYEVSAGRWYRALTREVSARTAARERSYLDNRAAYLTERQRQVLRSVALGYRTREIAQMLGLSVRAVHRQRERLRLALRLNSTAELTRFAIREGFTEEAAGSAR